MLTNMVGLRRQPAGAAEKPLQPLLRRLEPLLLHRNNRDHESIPVVVRPEGREHRLDRGCKFVDEHFPIRYLRASEHNRTDMTPRKNNGGRG